MINIISKPLEFDYELKKKIEIICDFCNTKPKIINWNIRDIEHSNLSYIEPHRVIIKGITRLNKDKEKDDFELWYEPRFSDIETRFILM